MARIFNLVGGGGGKLRLNSILVAVPPDKVEYRSGETFDPSGMAVEAVYSNGAKRAVTGYTYSPQVLTDGVTEVTVSYAEGRTVKEWLDGAPKAA